MWISSLRVRDALLDESVGYTLGHRQFFLDGKEIGKVPRLAICKDKDCGLFTLYDALG